MNNLEKYRQIFSTMFKVPLDEVETLEYQAILSWDSLGHMELMTALENDFNISLDIDDIIDFSSFQAGQKILQKYGIEL
jgi:acyl carrier protein